jgi:hypothetical protein
MKIAWLSWYVSAVLGLMLICSVFASYAPGAERFTATLQTSLAILSLFGFAVSSSLSRLSKDHWIHGSKTIWSCFIAAAILTTFMLMSIGG